MRLARREDALRRGADEVARVLVANGHRAVFAGGCVRDLVLGHIPKDYDIATDAVPERVARLFRRTVLVGAAFGVVRVLVSGDREYEVATFRTDGSYADGRRPVDVAYTSDEREDVARRDFTINALLLEVDSDEVIDHVGGLDDLARGLIRAVGEPARRFAEDKLRMLRAARFVARFGFAVEPATHAAIAAHARELSQVSVERVVSELHGVWTGPRVEVALSLLAETGLWAAALPFAREAPLETLGLRLRRLHAEELDEEGRRTVAWALLLDLAAPPDEEGVLRRFKLSRERVRAVLTILDARPSLRAAERASVAERARLLHHRLAPLLLAFLRAREGLEAPGALALRALAEEHARAPLPTMPLLGGAELLALGVPQGPAFKEVLAEIERATYERELSTPEEALAHARRYLAGRGP